MAQADTEQQPEMMTPAPEPQHEWLQKLVGEWTYEGEGGVPGSDDVHKSSGTERVRAIGELWITAESDGTMPGDEASKTIMTLGYDPAQKRFVGTWIGSMMTHLWVYDGKMDEAGKVLSLHCVGPSMAGDGTMAKYVDVIEIVDDNHRILSGNMLDDDGKLQSFMTTHYYRK